MLIVHAVQNLLNTSRLKPSLFITAPAAGQEMHSWYARLIATSFPGKLMVMYVHEPSLFLVLCKGKTINGTLPEFYERLPALLLRWNFKPDFVYKEMEMIKEGFVVSKTNNKSVLASMNTITFNIEHRCANFKSYDEVDRDSIEDSYVHWLTADKNSKGGFKKSSDYWKQKGLMKA